VSLNILSKAVTAIIGKRLRKINLPSGSQSMHELTPKTRWKARFCCTGKISIPKPLIPRLFAAVGMVFQKSIRSDHDDWRKRDRGLRLNGVRNQKFLNECLEKSLAWPLFGTK